MFGFKKKDKHAKEVTEIIKPTVPDDQHAKIGNPVQAEALEESALDIDYVEDPSLPPAEIKIRISADNMTAYLNVHTFSETQRVTFEKVSEMLELSNIVYGLQTNDIKNFCKNRLYHSEIVAAIGTPPTPGIDAHIEYLFHIDDSINLKEDEAGKVDFRELNVIQSVKAGDVLCRLHPAKHGTHGTNVHGDIIIGSEGIELEIKSGENVTLSADKLVLTANIDGCVEYKNGSVSVSDLFTVRGDVSSAVGNLNCLGSILINGDVREGFTVKSAKNIVIKGMVEGAHIIAGGDVTISSGMNGMNFGTIEAGGNIVSKYFENATITAENSIYSDVIINCTCHAKQSVVLKGGKGSLIGGNCTAGKSVYASFIGARTNVPTNITIESPEFRQMLIPDTEKTKQKQVLEAEVASLIAERASLEERIESLTPIATEGIAKAALTQLLAARGDAAGHIAHTQALIKELEVDNSQLGDYKVIALKTCFSGVKITMAYLYINIENDNANTKFFVSDHKIIPAQILPSDKIS